MIAGGTIPEAQIAAKASRATNGRCSISALCEASARRRSNEA
jgi:hypothetical protein